jgi:DeoR/GlpR family transcriptional regulator of sugar metabolism
MSKHAKVKVFMCDSTKFSSTSAFKLFSLSKVDYVVCDKPLSDKIIGAFSPILVKSSPAYLYKIEKKSAKM